MKPKILVTGATGNVGREVVRYLVEDDQPVIAAVMSDEDAARIDSERRLRVETRRFVFGEEATYVPALAGVDRLFLMRPPQIADVKHYLFPVIDRARSMGVDQIAFLSLLGADRNPLVPHHKVEAYLQDDEVPFTLLRPSFYMQNLNTTHRAEIRDDDEICVPVGDAKTSFIDVRDIGAVAARVLTEPGHEGKAYALTGGEALDYHQVADRFTEVLGRTITYMNPSVFTFIRRSRARGIPWKFALVMVGLYTATRLGTADRVTDTVAALLGRPPISMRQYIEDYAEMWQKSSS
jgi:uncharacterized protein YbjT (DUF2867 family)